MSEWGLRGKEALNVNDVVLFQLGIQKMTPDGLLLGAKSIVSQNKQLRKEMTDLEREITTLIEQNKAMVGFCVQSIYMYVIVAVRLTTLCMLYIVNACCFCIAGSNVCTSQS